MKMVDDYTALTWCLRNHSSFQQGTPHSHLFRLIYWSSVVRFVTTLLICDSCSFTVDQFLLQHITRSCAGTLSLLQNIQNGSSLHICVLPAGPAVLGQSDTNPLNYRLRSCSEGSITLTWLSKPSSYGLSH